MEYRCRLCCSGDLVETLNVRAPIAHRLLSRPDEAEETYPFALFVCRTCGLVQVCDPIDPDLLYRDFNYNFSSWKIEPHEPDEINTILAHGTPTRVFEIGCNDGRFMQELRDRTPLQACIGVEPNPVSGARASERGIYVVPEMISSAVCDNVVSAHGKFDLVISRQVVEHVVDLDNFFSCIDRVLAQDGLLFIDTPDSEPGFKSGDGTILWEEHCNYYTELVIRSLFSRFGFDIIEVKKYNFSGGTLAIVARRSQISRTSSIEASIASATIDLVVDYGDRVKALAARMRGVLKRARPAATVVIYGVGVRACAAVNMMGLGSVIDFAVDDQTERLGKFMPGCRLPIRPSAVLAEVANPLICLLAVNSENEEKVKRHVTTLVERPVRFASLCAPSDIAGDLARLAAAS